MHASEASRHSFASTSTSSSEETLMSDHPDSRRGLGAFGVFGYAHGGPPRLTFVHHLPRIRTCAPRGICPQVSRRVANFLLTSTSRRRSKRNAYNSASTVPFLPPLHCKRLLRSVLLCFLLALSLTIRYFLTSHVCAHDKSLVVVGARLIEKFVSWRNSHELLCYFL